MSNSDRLTEGCAAVAEPSSECRAILTTLLLCDSLLTNETHETFAASQTISTVRFESASGLQAGAALERKSVGWDMSASALAADQRDHSTIIGQDNVDIDNSNSSSSPRHVRFSPSEFDYSSGTSSAIQSLTSASTLSTLEGKLDLSPTDTAARKGLLRDSVFNEWKDDATDLEAESPEEMQKKDPLGTQIWKLYHKQKGQLPNSERLENLTWRMMSMNLRRKELERQG